jgi:hypothetical protein
MVKCNAIFFLLPLVSYTVASPISHVAAAGIEARSLGDDYNGAEVYTRDDSDKKALFTRSEVVQIVHEALQSRNLFGHRASTQDGLGRSHPGASLTYVNQVLLLQYIS